MIDLKTLKALVQLMVENDLTELDLKDSDAAVSLKRGGPHGAVTHVFTPAAHASTPPTAAHAPGASGAAPAEDASLRPVESPMVGTFYSSPDPESPPFIKPGDAVGADTVVCVIEAMKVFNEVKAGVSGVVERVLVENATPVEFGQRLFLVRPR